MGTARNGTGNGFSQMTGSEAGRPRRGAGEKDVTALLTTDLERDGAARGGELRMSGGGTWGCFRSMASRESSSGSARQ